MARRSLPALLVLGFTLLAHADTITWDGGGGDTLWTNALNWSGDDVPAAGDDVTISGGASVTLDASTPPLASLAVDGATLQFRNWTTLTATNVQIANAGALTLPGGFTTAGPSNRIHVVCSNFTVVAGATVNANAAGHLGGNGLGTGATGERKRGGGYGGRGGSGSNGDLTGYTHGNEVLPFSFGSGGGGSTTTGGAGGGAVLIEAAGTATLGGTILANGQNSLTRAGGGGSGGSVLIVCGTLGGTGLITANGGDGTDLGGAGGGGRIAVHYANTVAGWPGLRFSASPGKLGANYYRFTGQPGTLWLADTSILDAGLVPGILTDVVAYFGSGGTWSVDTLNVNSNRFRIATAGFAVQATGDVTIDKAADFDVPNLYCAGSLLITNGGILRVHADPTNAPNSYGGRLAVTNTITIAATSTLFTESHPLNGAAVLITADTVDIPANATLSGYGLGLTTGGGGLQSGTDGQRRAGGGHGGKGCRGEYSSQAGGGRPVGTPDSPSVGGGGCMAGDGGWGGALISIEADTVNVVGTINANGCNSGPFYGGGGAGGGVRIVCRTLTGSDSGRISANGGNGSGTSGGGGGGRIALVYEQADPWPDIAFSCSPGIGRTTNASPYPFQPVQGTLFLPDATPVRAIMDNARLKDVTLFIDDLHSLALPSLTVENCSFRFGETGFVLSVAGDLVVKQGGSFGVENLVCGGNLVVTNGGIFNVYARATNGLDDVAGALIDVAGQISVGPGSWIRASAHEVNGGAPLFRADHVHVAAGGGFWAAERGWGCSYGPGKGFAYERRRGAGHGGRGGSPGSYGASGEGLEYGFAHAPILPGSGGGCELTYPNAYLGVSGYGGGLLRIEARDTVTVNGLLNADGGLILPSQSSGGSGGGIFVSCREFAGSGAMSAKGANSAATTGGAAGGRIAIWKQVPANARALLLSGAEGVPGVLISTNSFPKYSGAVSVAGGTGYPGSPGGEGTIRFIDGRPRGTIFLIR